MSVTHRYPVGVQEFSKIREGGFLYVDKTQYLHRMATTGGDFYFLSRPRRFGKSLLVSTMQAYFEGRRELFHGLAIDRLQPEDWERYPVLRLDLSQVKATTLSELNVLLDDVFSPVESAWGVESRELPGSRLEAVVRAAHRETGKPVVVLIDEYDAPLLTVMHDPERLQEFREVTRGFYAPLKALSPLLRFVFLTGVSRFSQLSIFSELNNLQNLSMLPQYAGVCGITEDELLGQLDPDVQALAEAMEVGREEALAQLKTRYDGYHFASPSPDVYNPFSLMSALNNGRIDDYWFSSGTPTSLVEMIKRSDVDVEALDRGDVLAFSEDFDAPVEAPGVVPFMYQSGYLTIKSYEALTQSYRLGIPNGEVRTGLFRLLLPAFSGAEKRQGSVLVIELVNAAHDGDMERFLTLLRSFLSEMHRRVAVTSERDFQQVLYIILRMVGAYVRCEVSFAKGRADFVVQGPDAVFAVELKYSREGARTTVAEALAQVHGRGYLVPFEASEKPVVAVGVVFDEDERTITEWAME